MAKQKTKKWSKPKRQEQPGPKPFIGWALYNWGIPRGVYTTRRQAIEDACTSSGEPWTKVRMYYRVAKVRVLL
jgi:hypothetical protein